VIEMAGESAVMNPGDRVAVPYHRLVASAGPASAAQRDWTPDDGPMPAIYLGHGAPPLLESASWMGELSRWALALPKPRNILIVSAHWEAAPVSLTATPAATPLVYDFWGFAPGYYQLTYPTPDAADLAARVAAAMPDTEPVHQHLSRGLDHGAWVPLLVMYPNADVPVLQLSLPTHDPARLLDLGRRLRELRAEGTLVIGSGFLTHGLPYLTREQFTGTAGAPGWSVEFDDWAARALAAGDLDELARYPQAPGMPYAHPTVEHFSPLFVALGCAEQPDGGVDTRIDGYFFGLSKRSFQVA
jgi:4,5-DOPA dioxygenase extradiol